MRVPIELIIAVACGAFAVPVLNYTVSNLGSKMAGALGGFPATLAASIFVIGTGEGVHAAMRTVEVIPFMMGIDGIFFMAFACLSKKGLWPAVAGALGIWAILAVIPVFVNYIPLSASLGWMFFSLILSVWIMEKALKIPSVESPKIPMSKKEIFVRMFAGAGTVSAAYALSELKQPVIAGVAAAFPAVTITALIAIAKHLSIEAAAAFAKAITIHALVNAAVYAGAVYLFFVPYGPIWGTVLSVLLTLVAQIILYFIVDRYTA